MLIIFLGAPGSGKGTISEMLVKKYNFKHISTGNIFREQINSKTELGNKLKLIIENGNLVDDYTTWEIVKIALKKNNLKSDNVILDGYPRNIKQKKLMDIWLKENNIKKTISFFLDVPEKIILDRLIGRRICKICGKVWHIKFMPTLKEGICDNDGGELYQREDDQLENVKNRLKIYQKATKPLIDFYIKNNSIKIIDGSYDKEKIVKNIMEVLVECA